MSLMLTHQNATLVSLLRHQHKYYYAMVCTGPCFLNERVDIYMHIKRKTQEMLVKSDKAQAT